MNPDKPECPNCRSIAQAYNRLEDANTALRARLEKAELALKEIAAVKLSSHGGVAFEAFGMRGDIARQALTEISK